MPQKKRLMKKNQRRFSMRRFLFPGIFVITLLGIFLWNNPKNIVRSATYTWVQSAWTGGATANTGVHPTNQTGWTEYGAKDATVAAAATLGLSPQAQTTNQTTDTDFQSGTLSQAVVTGSGTSAGVVLDANVVENSTLGGYNSVAMNRIQRGFTLDTNRHKVWSTTIAAAWVNYRYASDGTYATSTPCNSQGYDPIYDAANDVIWQGGTGKTLCKISPVDGSILNTNTFASLPADIKMMTIDTDRGLLWFNAPLSGTFYSINTVTQALSGPYTYAASLTPTSGWGLDAGCLGAIAGPQNAVTYDTATQTVWGIYCESLEGEEGPADSAAILVGINGSNGTFTRAIKTGVSVGVALTNQVSIKIVPTASKTLWFNTAIVTGYSGFITYNPATGESTPVATPQVPLTAVYDSYHNSVWSVSANNFAFSKHSVEGVLQNTYDSRSTSPRTDTVPGNGCSGAVYDPYNRQLWHCAYKTNAPTGNGVVRYQYGFSSQYYSSGTLTSSIIDVGQNIDWTTTTWSDTLPASTTVTMKARSSNDPAMSGANDFSNPACATISKGQDISASGCVTDGHRYIQYQATLATGNTANTPTFNDITIGYENFQSGTLTSSVFDTLDATNVVGKIQWNSTGNGTVKYQLRTSADNASWTSWLGPTGTGDYYTDSTGAQTINASHRDGASDRYVQLKVFLEPLNGGAAPTVTSTTLSYVVNAPPEFQSAPTATQNADGTISISYSVRDADTDAGSTTPGFVTPSFEYSLDNGLNWNSITTGLSAGATTNKSVDDVNYSTYSATWTAKNQIDGTAATQAKIRVRVNDNEGANNITTGTSTAFNLDVKDPTLGSPAIAVDASISPAVITLNASDDSALEMCVTLTNTAANCIPYASSTTISLVTNPDTVYVIYRDARGNTSSASAVTPETPENLIIRDLSNLDANQYFLFISWRTVSTPLNQFGDYHVWHSTDGSTYALLTSISDRSVNYYLHQNLSDGSTHYYKVTSTDTDGNISTYSTVVSDTVNGQGGTDATPPTISAISAVATTQSVAITWDTDELSNSTVGYSATAGDFTTESGVATMVDSASGLGAHRVTIGGLTPNTTYYYRVQSSDPSGNLATSDNGGDGFSFTTTSGPAITNVTTPVIENTSAVISWKTNTAATSKVTYSTSAALTNSTSVESTTEVTTHALTLTNLTIGTRYYFQVQSGTGIDTNNGNYYTFVTTADTTAPVITNVAAVLVTDTQALIRWETNERSSSQVSYGTQPAAPTLSTAVDSVLNLTHSITLNNLTTETQYYFTVRSADAAGNSATSSEVSFTTREQLLTDSEVQTMLDELRADTDTVAPGITDVVVTPTSPRTATATWSTDETANSFLELTPTGGETMILGDWVYVSAHTLTAPALTPATTYAYRVISADRSGNISVTPSATFTTSALSLTELTSELEEQVEEIEAVEGGLPAPVIGGQPRVDVSATAATISWTTSTATDGLVSVASASAYQSAQSFEQQIASPTKLSTAHSVRLPNLQPDTAYVFRVSGQPKVGPTVTSATLPFQTLTKTFGIDNHTVEMISDEAAIFRWTTTEESTSVIQYVPYRNGTPAVEELRELRDDRTNFIHQMTITNFEPGAQYGVTLISLNSAGQQTSLAIDPFRTEANDAPPEISNIRIDSALSPGQKVRVQTIVAWQTNKPTTSQVQYRAGVQPDDSVTWEESPLDPSFTKRHIAILTTLNPGSVYQVQVKNRDANGQEVISQPVTFLTPQQQQSVFQVILNTVERTFGWTKIFN